MDRDTIQDILGRGNDDRNPELLRSDITRLADYLLWIYNEDSRPMVYDKGDMIDFEYDDEAYPSLLRIERRSADYIISTRSEESWNLSALSDIALMKEALRALLDKEFNYNDWASDMAK